MPHKSLICCRDGVCTMPLAPWHGQVTGYNNHRCRCGACTAAWAIYWREGAGAATKARYRAKLIAAGLTTDNGRERQVPYRPRPNRP